MADRLTEEQLALERAFLEIAEKLEKSEITRAEAMRQRIAAMAILKKSSEEDLARDLKRAELMKDSVYIQEQKNEIARAEAKERVKVAEAAAEAAGWDEKSEEHVREALKAWKAVNEEAERYNKAQRASEGLAASIASKLGMHADYQSTFLGSAISSADVFKGGGGLGETASNLVGNLGMSAKSFGNIAKSGAAASALVSKFVESTVTAVIEADKLRAQWVAVTGEVGGARNQFIDLALANTHLGVSMEQMMGAQLELRQGFAGFVNESDAAKASMTLHTATLEKMGIAASTSAEIYNTLGHALGQNTAEIEATSRELVGIARATGKAPQEISQEFTAAMPRLTAFGDRATDIFKGLQEQALATGVSVSELTSIFGDQMDTFEGTAKIAGQLNAVMGTDMVSATELLGASDEQRVEILRERLRLSGMDFDNMDQFQQRAVAHAAGIQDVATAAKLFGETQNEVAMTIGNTTVSAAEMEEMAMEATNTMDKFKFAMMQFAIGVAPLAEGLANLVTWMVEAGQVFPGGFASMMSVLTALAGFLMMAVPGGQVAGIAMITAGLAGGLASIAGGGEAISDGVIQNGVTTSIDSEDQVLAAKPGGPIDRALGAKQGNTGGAGTTLVVKVMLDARELGEAVIPHIDKRVLGNA